MVVIGSPKEFKDVTSESMAVVDCESRGEIREGRHEGRVANLCFFSKERFFFDVFFFRRKK